jgi:large subunit ribosomal protein L6
MSRIGKKPIAIPQNVKVSVTGGELFAQGPKGKLSHRIPEGIAVEVTDSEIIVTRSSDERNQRALHGLTRSIVANVVTGVSDGFAKELEVTGVGYRVEKSGKAVNLSLGYSHPVVFEEPEGISINVDKQIIRVEGIDKCLVNQTAAKIRSFKKPDVYKGKGIRYVGEQVRRKAGKAGAK